MVRLGRLWPGAARGIEGRDGLPVAKMQFAAVMAAAAVAGLAGAAAPGAAAGAVAAARAGVGGPASVAAAMPHRVGAAPVVPAGARAAGAASPSTPISFDVVLRPRNPAALGAFAAAVSTPGSASYHQFLAPAQFAARFAPSPAAIRGAMTALRGVGLDPGRVSANRLVIPVRTTVGRASAALGTRFENYRLSSGREAIANTSAPLLPAAAARVAQAVIGLNTLLTVAAAPPAPSRAVQAAASVPPRASGPQPCQAAVSERNKYGAWTYNQLARAYSIPGLYAKGDKGRGSTIALFELQPFAPGDISAFQACYGTAAKVTAVNVDGGPSGGPGAEATLDIETALAIAPKSKIVVYQAPLADYAKSTVDVYTKIDDVDAAGVLSTSWGHCETTVNGIDPGLIASENTLFEQAAIEGISVFAASGDTGSEACYQDHTSQKQLAVQDPASQPFVTSVGGTDLTALGPPPAEKAWNEGVASKLGAGGGGISRMWPMPAWQKGPGVVSGYSSGKPCSASTGYCREVPDVSASSDPAHGYVIFYGGKWTVLGGTSAAAPLWAGMLADIGSQARPAIREGFLNPRLYSMPGPTFNDVVSGNNDYTHTHGGRYPAAARYDMATGLGSPVATKLAQGLARWFAMEAPMPPGEKPRAGYYQGLNFVKCPSASRCDAFGGYTISSGAGVGMALMGSGAAWAPKALPNGLLLQDEACEAPKKCVAAGDGSLFTGWGLSWTPQQVPAPPGASLPFASALDAVVCPSRSECVAVGDYSDTSNASQGLIVTGSGSSWASVKAPVPSNAAADPFVILLRLACPSVTSCTAVGYYTTATGKQEGMILTGSGKSWTATEAPLPAHAGAAANPQVQLGSVACVSASSCTVVGTYTNPYQTFKGMILTGSGATWTAMKPPLPANAENGGQTWLSNIVCPTTGSCTIAGSYTDSSGNQQGMVLNGLGSSWTPSETPLPAHALFLNDLGKITCQSAKACLILGSYLDTTWHPRGLLLTGAGKNWTAIKAPVPANSSSSKSNYIELSSAACHSALSCVVVGDYTDKSGYPEPLILVGPIK